MESIEKKQNTESAFDLFQRVHESPNEQRFTDGIVHFLKPATFTYLQVCSFSIIPAQVQGAHSSGRTEFLYQLLLCTILPAAWGPIPIGGLGLRALYFDLDLKFCTSRFLLLMQHKIAAKQKAYLEVHGENALDTVEMEGTTDGTACLIVRHL